MKAAPSTGIPGPLLDAHERFPWFLFFCVFLSLLAHAGSFLVFQVVYPQHVSVPPPPPQVQLLSTATPQYEAIMNWVDAEDPALAASAHSVRPANLLEVLYQPSYAVQRTAPRGVPEARVTVQFPAARNPLAVIRSAEQHSTAAPASPGSLATRLILSPPFSNRALAQLPDLAVSVRTAAPVEPSRYLIGVSDRGEVRFVFLQQSSGNPALDAAGAKALTRATFAAQAIAVSWGHATIAWGDEVIEEEAKSEIQARK